MPAPLPSNQEEDLQQMYSGTWFRSILSQAVSFTVPRQYRDIFKLSIKEQNAWHKACEEEYNSLKDRKVWDLVDLPKGRQPIKGRWVFAVKSDGRQKARFVAKGFTQIFGIDYEETFSPVARFETVHLILALVAINDWKLEALDIKTSFLFGELDKEIYLVQPEGFVIKGQESKVCRLNKAIYGLKQAALQWNKALHKLLIHMGFKRTTSDPGVYVLFIGRDIIILLIYVDDALFISSSKPLLKQYKTRFMKTWESRDLGEATEYLGMRITRNRKKHTLTLDQTSYADKVVKQFQLDNCKPTYVPLPTGYNPRPSLEDSKPSPALRSRYQSVIGSLLYIMLGTRPDIAFSVIKMSQFSANPSEEHLQKSLYIVRYLATTKDLCLTYGGTDTDNGLIAYSDTDWAGDIETSRSTTGYGIFFANSIISWLSRHQ